MTSSLESPTTYPRAPMPRRSTVELPSKSLPPRAEWLDIVLPREHGSWSLAFEPLVLGLLCAPSIAGGFMGAAVAAGFFCRRPLRIALHERREARRRLAWRIVGVCALLALAAFAITLTVGGGRWLPWLVPTMACGGLFSRFDLKNDGREEVAEIAGAAAFAWLPASLAALGGWTSGEGLALASIMCCRALPTVIFVRAVVRGRKSGCTDLKYAIATTILALALAIALGAAGLAPWLATAWCGLFLARILFIGRYPAIRAKTLGIFEAVAGVVFVLPLAFVWPS